jgi:hypothetical protein
LPGAIHLGNDNRLLLAILEAIDNRTVNISAVAEIPTLLGKFVCCGSVNLSNAA